ncbi:MAG: MBL fold metallo-hydrolase [Myxococcaceae bacterium]
MFRRVLKFGCLTFLAVFALTVLIVLPQAWESLGHRASGERRARMEKSPQWKGGSFENPEPIINNVKTLTEAFSPSADASPKSPPEVMPVDPGLFETPPVSGVRATWLGHSTTLIEVDGVRVLTDPVWSERPSPLTWVGPTRYFPPLIALEKLPKLDAVIISHDHYDHLDMKTVQALISRTPRFIVPLGVGAHLEYWGVPAEKITEVDWWDRVKVGDVEVVSTPVRHASGRQVLDRDATLWSSYALVGPTHRVWFSGDTGLFTAVQDIGEKLGPFDLTLIEVGQYHRGWPDWHLGPEQAVQAHQLVRGKVFFPIHWGLFTLAYHAWTEPIERASLAAKSATVRIVMPKPGQSVDVPPATEDAFLTRWWPTVPFDDVSVHPIVSGNVVLRGAGGTAPAGK